MFSSMLKRKIKKIPKMNYKLSISVGDYTKLNEMLYTLKQFLKYSKLFLLIFKWGYIDLSNNTDEIVESL